MFKYFGTAADSNHVPPASRNPRRRALLLVAVAASLIPAATVPSLAVAKPKPAPASTAQQNPDLPVAVALDRKLAKPQPEDSKQTRAARAKLAAAQRAYAAANQQYDQASAAVDIADLRLAIAQRIAAAARAAAAQADSELATIAVTIYQDGSPVPVEAQVLLAADSGNSVLNDLERAHQIATYQSDKLAAATAARDASDRAEADVRSAQAAALDARNQAVAAQQRAAASVKDAQRAVGSLHLKDLLARARAAARAAMIAGTSGAKGPDTAAGAAAALMQQAIDDKAVTAADYPSKATLAAIISISARALIRKAATLGTAPTDVTDVMGPTPVLGGSVKWKGKTGAGDPLALTPFDGHLSRSNWPSAGVGTKVAGTAPFLKSDGISVHPRLPAYPKGYRPLRAEVAVDSALRQLGSPYVWDAAGPRTYDCSGLTLWAWGHAGVPLEHFTGTQVTQGVRVKPNQLVPGDLLLFGKDLHHVGMYLGAGYMIDAPQTGDYVKIQLVSDMGDFAVAVRP